MQQSERFPCYISEHTARRKTPMKHLKRALILLLLLALLPLGGLAEEPNDFSYQAVVANPRVGDRLNLRAQPDQKSDTLGRFYSGTPVLVLEERGEWALVRIGKLEGYMLLEYLMPKNRNYGAPELFYTAQTKTASTRLLASPDSNGKVTGVVTGKVELLGDSGDDWRYVHALEGDVYGFVRTSRLTNHQVHIPFAYLTGADAVTVYADKECKKALGSYYAGVRVEVTDLSRSGNWAEIYIHSQNGDEITRNALAGDVLEGYVPLESLLVFTQRWQVISKARTAVALKDFTLKSDTNIIVIKKGAPLTVLGTTEKGYHVWYRGAPSFTAFADKSLLQITQQGATRYGPECQGYLLMDQSVDSDGWDDGRETWIVPGQVAGENTYSRTLQWLGGSLEGYYAARFGSDCFYVNEADVTRLVLREDLWAQGAALTAGEHVASAAEEGLWVLRVPAGKSALLTLENAAWKLNDRFSIDAADAVEYTVFIPRETQITLTGEGALTPVSGPEQLRVVTEMHPEEPIPEGVPLFSGTGRFFVPDQLANDDCWYFYRITPLAGSAESWLTFSSLNPGENDGDPFRLDSETPEYYPYTYLGAGYFLELHNCVLELTYGNG